MLKLSIFLAFLAIFQLANTEYAPIVEISTGKVRGVVQEAYDEGPNGQNYKVNVYQGIRYGQAERFSKPKPEDPWKETYNATGYRFACPQQSVPFNANNIQKPGLKTLVANEDCLFVSVYQPVETKPSRPVMVWIHGGGFTEGTIFSVFYNARYIAALGDVIVVTVNYRLDAFGFLYGGTEEEPGNLGLYDQILALKWVQQNIAKFGGDPSQVTVFGESAGSFSVSALILSPLTKGLFQKAIMQSGATNSWLGSQPAARSLEITQAFAKKLNCPEPEDKVQAIKCLRSKSVTEILEASSVGLQNGESFLPSYGEGNELLPLPPVKALKEGKFNADIDLMYGTTRNEGSMFVVELFNLPQLDPSKDGHDMTLDAAKTFISFMMSIFKDPKPEEVTDFYVKHLNLTVDSAKDDLRRSISFVFGDYHLVCPTMFFGEAFAKHAPANRKLYSYRLMKGVDTPVMNCYGWMGVCHAMDVVMVFGMPLGLRGIAFTEEEAAFSRELVSKWANFAKSGEPGKLGQVNWEPAITKEDPVTRFIEIDPANYRMVSDFYKETCDAFWKPRIFN